MEPDKVGRHFQPFAAMPSRLDAIQTQRSVVASRWNYTANNSEGEMEDSGSSPGSTSSWTSAPISAPIHCTSPRKQWDARSGAGLRTQRLTFQTLCANMALNSLDERLLPHVAVGAEQGEIKSHPSMRMLHKTLRLSLLNRTGFSGRRRSRSTA